MKIVVKKEGKWFVADRPALAGAPYVGRGKTRIAALGELLFQARKDFGVEIEFDESAQGRWPKRYYRT
jgi:hypothetical protein